MASRVILLVSPLLLLFPASLRIAGYRTASMIFLLLVNGGVGALVRWHASRQRLCHGVRGGAGNGTSAPSPAVGGKRLGRFRAP